MNLMGLSVRMFYQFFEKIGGKFLRPLAIKGFPWKHKPAIFSGLVILGLILSQIFPLLPPANALWAPGPIIYGQSLQSPNAGEPLATTPMNAPREFRGVWVASVANIDWPSKPGLSVDQQKAELLQILNRMQQVNLNALILQVRPAGDAFYQSSLEPWSYWLTGTQGKAPDPNYDPLRFAIEESHKRNIELHAWFNPYRARNATNYPLAANNMARKFPQYAYQYGNLLWMDPGAKEVQDQTYNVIMDVVRRYDVDGIHIDDYFYPYPESGISFPDNRTYNAYRDQGGTLSLADWRRDNVNKMVQRLWDGIKAEKPFVKFGISPFGIYRPGTPPGIVGLDQYESLYADVKLWLEKGWLDYLAPQLYWRIDPPQQSYPALLNWWLSHNPQRRHIYVGNYLSRLGDWPLSEFERQVQISRSHASRLSLGNIFFSMKVLTQNWQGVVERFRSVLYPTPALVPEMPWLPAKSVSAPTGMRAGFRQLQWDQAADQDIRSWALYEQKDQGWQMIRLLNANTTRTWVRPGQYALRAVDRTARQSEPVVISVR